MRGYDADITRLDLNKLYLTRCTPWESDNLGAEATESEGIVCSLEFGKFLRR